MTTIAIISDTHLHHGRIKIPDVDILIHCGDATNMGRPQEIAESAKWLHEQPCKRALFCPGNHDFGFQRARQNSIITLMRNGGMLTSEKVVYLEDQSYEYEGIKFYGTPWTNQFYDWAFMKPDHELKEVFDRIPEDTDILITHGPPRNILDMNDYGVHCGSPALRQRVDKMKLKYCVFGHIHPSNGTMKTEHNGTIFINAAAVTDQYEIQKNIPFLIKI